MNSVCLAFVADVIYGVCAFAGDQQGSYSTDYRVAHFALQNFAALKRVT